MLAQRFTLDTICQNLIPRLSLISIRHICLVLPYVVSTRDAAMSEIYAPTMCSLLKQCPSLRILEFMVPCSSMTSDFSASVKYFEELWKERLGREFEGKFRVTVYHGSVAHILAG
jgi:hypothetical protein